MKNLLIVFLLGVGINANAQSAFRFNVGYSLPIGTQLLASESTYSSSGGTSTNKGVYGTFGSGWNFGASYVRMFSKFAGLEVNASYFQGSTYSSSSKFTSSFPPNIFTDATTMSGRVSGFLFSPQFILQPAIEKSFQPYAKAGIVLGAVRFSEEYTQVMTNSAPVTSNKTTRSREYTGGLPLGFRGGIGIVFNAGKKASFFTEFQFTTMSYYPSKSTVTSYTVNGVDAMNSLSESAKTTIYKNEVTTNLSANPTQPSESVGGSFPLSNIMLNVGLQIKLGTSQEVKN